MVELHGNVSSVQSVIKTWLVTTLFAHLVNSYKSLTISYILYSNAVFLIRMSYFWRQTHSCITAQHEYLWEQTVLKMFENFGNCACYCIEVIKPTIKSKISQNKNNKLSNLFRVDVYINLTLFRFIFCSYDILQLIFKIMLLCWTICWTVLVLWYFLSFICNNLS